MNLLGVDGLSSLFFLSLARISSRESTFLLRLIWCIQFILTFKGLDFLLLLLFSNLFQLLLRFPQFFLFNFVIRLKLVLQVVNVTILIDIRFLKLCEFFLQSLIFLHECWLNCKQVSISLFVPFEFCSLLFKFFFQYSLLLFHIAYIFGHFSGALLLLLHDCFNAGFDESLIISLIHPLHPLKKINSL